MKKNRIKRIRIFTIIILIFTIVLIPVFGRYVVKKIKYNLTNSKEIYFYSDKLQEKQAKYSVYFEGLSSYSLPINLFTKKNELVGLNYDLPYEITYLCSDNAVCRLNKTSGKISSQTNSDEIVATITPNTAVINENDEIELTITAKTTDGFKKELSAKFIFLVGRNEYNYQIDDKENSDFLTLGISNLDIVQKNVTVSIDSKKLLVDPMSNGLSDIESYEVAEDDKRIKKIKLVLKPNSTYNIRIFKIDRSKNYSKDNEVIKLDVK